MTWRTVILLLFVPILVFSQTGIPIGTWRTHFSYRDAHSLALATGDVYCAGNNTLFLLSFVDNSVTPFSKVDGLSRVDISTLGYNSDTETLIIAYQQGTLDLLQQGSLTEISAIANADNNLSKTIFHIHPYQDLAFVSGAFGVARLSLSQQEIQEAYVNIGSTGNVLSVNAATTYNDSLFLASEEGVIAGRLDPQINLLDFTNWRRYGATEGIVAEDFQAIASFNDQVYAARSNDGIYFYQGQNWQRLGYDLMGEVLSASGSGSAVLITTTTGVVSVDNNQTVTELSLPANFSPQSAVQGQSNIWLADSLNGLTSLSSSGIFPSGPYTDSIANIVYLNQQMVALPPGFDRFRRPIETELGFSWYLDNDWEAYNNSGDLGTLSLPSVVNLIQADYSLSNQRYYFASFGQGILEWNPDGDFQLLDDASAGSTLIRSNAGQVLVSSVLVAPEGGVWATNYGNSLILHHFDPALNSWQSFATPFLAARFPLDMKLTDQGDIWCRLDPNNGGGIWVINPESGSQKLLTTNQNEGGLPTSTINDLEIDLEGQVWLATDEGVAVYPFPFDILERSEINSSLVFIDGRPLLRDENVTAIAVDGGNRKWMGTDNGIWLFSELGDSVIFNFTEANSPLPSNKILDIAIDPGSGEVFVLTDLGLVSYRSTATRGSRRHQQVKIFPNPVDASFNGLVGISGLTNNAIVKITDVSGKLVTEVRAQGGTATWNVADYGGRRVVAGVYLVFSSSADGEETFVGKIAVFN